MKIDNLDYVFQTLEGDNLLETIKVKDEKGKIVDAQAVKAFDNGNLEVKILQKEIPVTLKKLCIRALHALRQDEKIDGNEKERRGALARELYEAKNGIELDRDDVKLIKELIGRDGSPMVIHQAWKIIDPEKKVG